MMRTSPFSFIKSVKGKVKGESKMQKRFAENLKEDFRERFVLEGTTLIIFLPKDLDHPVADLIRKEAENIAGRTYIRRIVFDFSETEFMDSSGVGLLMGRYRALGMRKECIRAIGVNRHIERLLRLSGLHRYIEIEKAGEEVQS